MIAEAPSTPEALLGTPVDPARIDAGLLQLWQEHETATRASLMNLAVYSENPGALLENTRLVYGLTLEHACRVILIEALTESAEQLTEAWITAHCSLGPDGRKAVCCEQLAFRMHGYSPARLTNLLFANLESDLPLVLWWQAPLSVHFDRRIYSRIDRLIVDSLSWQDPQTEFPRLLKAYQDRRHHFVIHDLNWTRTCYLRLAIAAGFEDQSALQALTTLKSIEIRHGRKYQSTAYLLAAWIADRLDGPAQETPVFEIRPHRELDFPIAQVIFHTAQGKRTLSRSAEGFYTWDTADGTAARPFHAGSDDLSVLLMDQLGRGGCNGTYLNVLRRALDLRQEIAGK